MKNLKKITLLAACTLFGSVVTAQEEMDNNGNDYNRWSIELNAGVHKPSRPLSGGTYVNTPDFFQGDLGVRYMFNQRFGLKLDAGYQNFEAGDDSFDFQSTYLRGSLQGVVNAGNVLKFREWTNTFGLLVHAGGGYSRLTPQEPVERDGDNMLHLIAGVTPQVRLSDRIALTGDLSAIANIRQDYTFDGLGQTNTRGVNGLIVNASVGITFYLGKSDKHADWYNESEDGLGSDVSKLEEEVEKIKSDMQDTDRDGVPDYLDQEPNTMNGVAVDSKGVAVDKNGNGIPDEIEDSLDSRYASKDGETGAQGAGGAGTIKKLINDGYVNVYFKFNSDEPEAYSLQSVNYLVKYMMENESAEAELTGYSDEIGNPEYNKQLSERRAKKVYDILVASGVDADRLSYTGGGEDNSVEKSSKDARQLVRRVTFKLK